ncbi:MAG: hypothetical protein QM765_16300 [Myxococcales bacterium]
MAMPMLQLCLGIACASAGGWLLTSGLVGLGRRLELPHVLSGRTLLALATTIPVATIAAVASAQRQTEFAVAFVLTTVVLNVLALLQSCLSTGSSPFAGPGGLAVACLFLLAAAGVWTLPAVSGAGESISAWGLLLVGAAYLFFDGLVKLHDRNVYSEVRSVLVENQSAPGSSAWAIGAETLLGGAAVAAGSVLVTAYAGVAEAGVRVPVEAAGAVAAAGVALPGLVAGWRAIKDGVADIAMENTLGRVVLSMTLALGLAGAIWPSPVIAAQRWASVPIAAVALVACGISAVRARHAESWSLE